MDCAEVMLALRRNHIAVLHAVQSATTDGGRDLIVVFLEASYGQAPEARRCLRNLPGVYEVTFARHTKAIMYVLLRSNAGHVPAPER